MIPALPAALWACVAPDPVPPVAEVGPTGVVVTAPGAGADGGITRVRLRDPDGLPVVIRRLPAPVGEVAVPWQWERGGTWTVEVTADGRQHTLPVEVAPPAGGVVIEVDAPVGAGGRLVADGEVVSLVVVEGGAAQAAVTATALEAGEYVLTARPVDGAGEETREERATLQPGDRVALLATVTGPVEVTIDGPGAADATVQLVPETVSAEALAATLVVTDVALPADAAGLPDPGRPEGRVTLPARWWSRALFVAGLGVRARDPWAPWSHVGVGLENRGARDQSVLVRMQILDGEGQPAAAFQPRLRDGDDGSATVRALLRVPAGRTVRAALPLFVDEARLDLHLAREQTWTRRIEVLPLGGSEPLAVDEAPLYASRGSTVASLGLVGALVAAVLGTGLLARRGGRWLSEARTSELMTIGLFGAMTFVVGAVGRLLTMGLSSVLGPFATFATGLVDDCLRYTLLATLLSLLPRPGTASLAVLTGWLLSGVALGSFGPTDLLFVSGRVFWLELLLWVAGVTRPTGWQDQARALRWLRLTVGLGGASLLTSATGLVLHVTLYRLFLAEWYVAAVLALPGFLYVALACAVAVPFAESLRRIQR